MKKIALALMILTFAVGCKSLRKNSDGSTGDSGSGNTDSTVKSETTASGGSEKIDASPMNFAATGSDSGSISGLQSVFFEYDKSTLSSAEKAKLTANVEWLKKNSNSKMTIEGHCDQRGSNEYNLSLGERRANAVKQMMQSMGVSVGRLTTVSFGEEKPLLQGESDGAMMKNRRANFVPAN
jgi:peptidoglycan-associated lipoprotein